MDQSFQSNTSQAGNKAFFWINIIGCLLFFCLPYLFGQHNEDTFSLLEYLGICVVVVAHLMIFYINYLGLVPRLMFHKKWIEFFSVNLLLILFVAFLLSLWQSLFMVQFRDPQHVEPIFTQKMAFMLRDMLFMVLTASLAVAIRMTVQWQTAEREKAKVEAVASTAELQNLKNQINPHFLFNTLNNIYALMVSDNVKAQDALLRLSRLLRHVLYEDRQNQVSLDKELEFTRNYIELMLLRFTDRVKVTYQLPTVPTHKMVAPLLFISLIENAFKHGVSQDEPSFVDIQMTLNPDGSEVKCVVRNSYFPKNEKDYSGSGIGVENLQRRLSLLYPDGQHVYTHTLIDHVYQSELTIKLTT